jgi:hypothetical protein
MRFLAKRPSLYVWATTVALMASTVIHQAPCSGLHDW